MDGWQASVIGIYFGKRKWRGCNKTIEGTMAAIVAMVGSCFAIAITCTSNVLELRQSIGLVLACVLAALMEAFTTQHDNLILPLFFDACLSVVLYNSGAGGVECVGEACTTASTAAAAAAAGVAGASLVS